MRFHVLAVPHTITDPEYSSCAFTQKVVKLCTMLMLEGHEVIHYGHALSKVEATSHVTVVDTSALELSYPGHDWRTQGWPKFNYGDIAYREFYKNAIREIGERKQPGDFLLCPFGEAHRPISIAHPDLIPVESGIGYPSGSWAPYRIFESHSVMAAHAGPKAVEFASNDFWYHAVIPNSFNLKEFEFSSLKHDYMLFLGRVNMGKGIHIATDLAERTKTLLMVAGAQDPWMPDTEYVKYVGLASPKKRCELLKYAKATICASTFMEPFCGVQIESMISGTPVISSNWGAFAEYNKHGSTGYRCNTMEQFEWAVRHVHKIRAHTCRTWGMKFSNEAIAPLYTEFFKSVKDIYGGKGFYEPRPERKNLDRVCFQ